MSLVLVVGAIAFIVWAFALGGDGSKTLALGLVFVLLVAGPVMLVLAINQRNQEVTAYTTDPRDGVSAVTVDCGSVNEPLVSSVACEDKLNSRGASADKLFVGGILAIVGSVGAIAYAATMTSRARRSTSEANPSPPSPAAPASAPGTEEVASDTTLRSPDQEPSPKSNRRACPYCAESIMREAILCRYCNREVEPV